MMTYTELKNHLSKLTEDQLKMNVTIHIESNDEYFPIEDILFADKDNDQLDENHPYLRVK